MPLLDPLLPLAPVIDPIVDPLVTRAARAVQRLWSGPPMRVAQARARERALDEVVARYLPQARALCARVRARDAEAIEEYDSMVARAVHELRTDAEARAARRGVERFAHAIDRALYANHEEWLDDPTFDRTLRLRTLDRLDAMNEALGTYDAFFDVITPCVERARAAGVERPVIVDLASGHGMFAVSLALRFGAREGKVRVIATDLVTDYLSIGRAAAEQLAMGPDAIDFLAQDALDLRDLAGKVGAPIDVVCCTQTVHHFPPGLVARLLAEAHATARHGAVIVDGERNPFALVMVAVMGGAIGKGSIPFFHDSLVSIRRMYTEQELALIARLSPRNEEAGSTFDERGYRLPGHAWLVTAGQGQAVK